jgi:hypothetical protein
MNVQFGTGVLTLIPNSGNLAVNPSPQTVGILQEANVDFSADLKELFGQKQIAIMTARGKMKVTGKAKLALLDPNMLNQIYFGQVAAVGVQRFAYQETYTLGSPIVATYTVTNGINFTTDYGVIGGSTGKQFVKILVGTPAVGQYKVSAAGLYTFAAGETELSVLISYMWNDATKGTTITLSNQLMGFAPYCQMLLYNNFRNVYFAVELYSCVLGKIMLPTKQEDFWIMDIEWTCNVNSADQLGKLYAET